MFDIEKARQAEELAAQCLSDLCHARRRWEMHIPLQSDDPDVLLGDALGQLRGAIKEVEQQRQRAEAAEKRLVQAEWGDVGFCPHCHQDELRSSSDEYDDEQHLSVTVYRCGACGAMWAGGTGEWIDLAKQIAAATARAEAAEAMTVSSGDVDLLLPPPIVGEPIKATLGESVIRPELSIDLDDISVPYREYEAMQKRAEAAEARAVNWISAEERLPESTLRVLAVMLYDGRKPRVIRAMHVPAKTVECLDWEFNEAVVYDSESERHYFGEGWYELMEEGEYDQVGPLSDEVTHWAKMPELPERFRA